MKEVKHLVHHIDEEVKDALYYAEKYVDAKAHGKSYASTWHKLAEDELHHADLIHEIAVEEISVLKKVYQPTPEMEKAWEESHMKYVEKTAWIRKMLAM